MSKDIETMWQSFWDAIREPGMPEIQRTKMRRAFYAGCLAMLQGCSSLGGDDISEDEGVRQMQKWRDELREFRRLIQAGQA